MFGLCCKDVQVEEGGDDLPLAYLYSFKTFACPRSLLPPYPVSFSGGLYDLLLDLLLHVPAPCLECFL